MSVKFKSYRVGARIRITHGQLEGATGVVSMMSADNLKHYLTIDGTVGGVYVIASSDMLTMDAGVTSDPMTSEMTIAMQRTNGVTP